MLSFSVEKAGVWGQQPPEQKNIWLTWLALKRSLLDRLLVQRHVTSTSSGDIADLNDLFRY